MENYMVKEIHSPREFLKARRPERFSDTVLVERSLLDRSMLEYHLDTLTNRGQETDFERFARRLAGLEICPNLLPQTGPTGGGDSKVDSETYPVADDLAFIWSVGYGREAASERWGFAFSAKQDWRPKVRSDIAKIAATSRGYVKAFFVSNQYIPDRIRAEVEDELRNQYNLDVRILDRTWILDRVFKGKHETVAIEELNLSTQIRTEVLKGPRDVERESDLEEIEKRIQDATQKGRFGYQFVEDCLEATLLARGLERPRTLVDGLFQRAERAANKYGNFHQQLCVIYQQAWTTYWWYEDLELFIELYGIVEKHAKDSRNAYDLELLTNLWSILIGISRLTDITEATTRIEERTTKLTAEWERLRKEEGRLSTALQARSQLLLMRMTCALPSVPDSLLEELQDVIRKSEGLVGFPLEPLVRILIESGDVIGSLPAYDELFETVVNVISTREGEVAAARMLVKRGIQQLDRQQPYEAIRTLGRALKRLYKHESRHDVVKALYFCGNAYEQVGLLWAARGTLLNAASIATNDFWSYSDITPLQAACYNRLKWVEMQIGRIPYIFSWHQLDQVVSGILNEHDSQTDQPSENELLFDSIFAILLLKSDLDQLKQLSSFPDVLDSMGLYSSSIALHFALGHEDELPKSLIENENRPEGITDLFIKWRDQPAAQELPPRPLLCDDTTITFNSSLLGCKINLQCENSSPCLELAESMLAAFESLLSTGLDNHLISHEPALTINIQKSDDVEISFEYEVKDTNGRPYAELKCSDFNPHSMSLESQSNLKDKLLKLLMSLFARIFLHNDFEQFATKLFRDELAIHRAIDFTSSFVALGNVLGNEPKTRTSAWANPKARDYPLKRSEVWDTAEKGKQADVGNKLKPHMPAMGKGEPPADVVDASRTKHSQMETVSLIREVLWNRAGWFGTAFIMSADYSFPPVLALMFKNAEAARDIFAEWRNELGSTDTAEKLKLTIIQGIAKENKFAYRVSIGTDPDAGFSRSGIKYAIMVSRSNTMESQSDQYLTGFLAHYKRVGCYFLAYAIQENGPSNITPVMASCILKRKLTIRDAWTIGMHDPDSMGIRSDDDPIIPPDHKNVPVLELLQWMKGAA
jgi:tetratricopeptide (TPR) repeat protein